MSIARPDEEPTSTPDVFAVLIEYCQKQVERLAEIINSYPAGSSLSDRIIDESGSWSIHLSKLCEIRSYDWFSEDTRTPAQQTFKGALSAVAKNKSSIVSFQINALVRLYGLDRALHAATFLRTENPIEYTEIPKLPPGMQPFTTTASGVRLPTHLTLIRSVKTLNEWGELGDKTPLSVIPTINALLEIGPIPDSLSLVTYEEHYRVIDSVIYARYGSWYVHVVESK